ncbi:MAG: aldo/keto reductase [Ruminococcaceae bacterium]|nr:aldo/keto reductase [Oscillospiraceae bacterium]
MEYVRLGKRSLEVSRLCFGSLTVGPLQAALSVDEGSSVIAHAFNRGVNFIDTAQYYQNYEYIREAMRKSGRYDTVISSKTYAYSKELALEAVDEARKALNRDYIDIFMLHEQESIHTLRGHAEALDTLIELREKGIIRSVGVSMHRIAAIDGILRLLLDVDIIHPIYNKAGLGIADGTRDEMHEAMLKAKESGIGIFSMKPLGGGHLYSSAEEAFNFVLDSEAVDAVACGMQTVDEVDANIDFFEKRAFSEKAKTALSLKTRKLHIEDYCIGCGKCASRCGQSALKIIDGRAVCDTSKCVLCGYCSAVCPDFAIKVL